jgi:outer membrane protein
MKKMQVLSISMAAVLAALASSAVSAQENTWMMRVRALNMNVDNGNSPSVPNAKVSLDNKVFPEIDFSYNFTKNISTELILTYPQRHSVKLNGSDIGSVKHLPPTLTLQYQFAPGTTINPYVGAGINYTRLMNVNLPAGVSASRNSFGGALQVGVDIELEKNVYLNLDYKYVKISTDVSVLGNKLTTLQVDPSLFSIGIGWRF